MERTDLSARMIALANRGHVRAKELREKADAFDAATRGSFLDPPTHTIQQLMGSWGSARRLFTECGGVAVENLGQCSKIRRSARHRQR